MRRPSCEFGPMSTVVFVARRAGNVVGTYQAAFPPKGTTDREDAILFLRQWIVDHSRRLGYTLHRVRAH